MNPKIQWKEDGQDFEFNEGGIHAILSWILPKTKKVNLDWCASLYVDGGLVFGKIYPSLSIARRVLNQKINALRKKKK